MARNSLTRFHTTFNLGCYTSDDQITITTHSTSVRSVKMSVHMSVCRDSFLILKVAVSGRNYFKSHLAQRDILNSTFEIQKCPFVNLRHLDLICLTSEKSKY